MNLYAVVTRWVGMGTAADPYVMEVAKHYPAAAVSDVVGHAKVPSVPNVALAAVLAGGMTAATLEADPRYDGLILWRWSPGAAGAWERTALVSASEAGAIRDGLLRLGLTLAQITALAVQLQGKTRAEICEAMVARARALASAR